MKTRSYSLKSRQGTLPIRFGDGGMEWVAEQIAETLGSHRPRVLLISDEQVALHYALPLRDALEEHQLATTIHVFPPGESQKNMQRLSSILDVLTTGKFARDDVVIGLGGGVVTDIAGFAASIYLRGIDWFASPTSLLGMVDAAIGGKTGVNHELGKNLIGTFHQPRGIFADLSTLATLPAREIVAGSAELVKAALLSGGELWDTVREHGPDLNKWLTDERNVVIPESAKIKIEIVEADERELSTRMLLNFGHTIGHALESSAGYGRILHGEAVFLGMRAALRLSERASLMSMEHAMELDETLRKAPVPAIDVGPEPVLDALSHDKKHRVGTIQWILLKDAGVPIITQDVTEQDIREVVAWICEAAKHGRPSSDLFRPRRVVILNGPNLNLLGTREPEVYGNRSYDDLVRFLHEFAERENIELLIRQSNSEAELVSLIQCTRHWADGLIINPGGYTHTSVAIRDAISGAGTPTVEVHLSDISSREEFRKTSLIAPVCRAQISGKGFEGYTDAMKLFLDRRNS